MHLELQHLRQVLALAEHGSFVRAAAALHISQPGLSRSVQNLEKRLGGALFVRSKGGVVPTDAGRLYVEKAREVLRLASELDRDAMPKGTFGAGRVTIGGGTFPVLSILCPAAVRFVAEQPRIAVQVRPGDWDDLLRGLRNREFDFFVAESSTLQREADIEISPMSEAHRLYLVVRAGHPLARRRPVSFEEALEWPFVSPSRVPPRVLDPALAAHRNAARRSPSGWPFPSILCTSLAAVKSIVASSDAVTASIASCVADELRSGRFVLVGTEPWLHLSYGLVSLKDRPWTAAAERMRQLVLEAERESVTEERRLIEEFAPRPRPPARGKV